MNSTEKKYTQFSICHEMLETPEILTGFSINAAQEIRSVIHNYKKIFITGEGSSRLFPGKNCITRSLIKPGQYEIRTEAALQAMEYDLTDYLVIGLSNSGKTKEVVRLFDKLAADRHPAFYSITANPDNPPIAAKATGNFVLSCGAEKAVAATKSVMEQAFLLDVLLWDKEIALFPGIDDFSRQLAAVLQQGIDQQIVEALSIASKIYLVGRDNGVGDELALKTNEITRKRSMFLPGSYALHGIEEVMDATEVMLLIDPFPDEEKKFRKVFADNIGMKVFAIASRQTIFPTIIIPEGGFFSNYLRLAAGWNLLIEVGLQNGIDLDKGLRARKIGNEV